jgi:sigma-B regulation protein RsbQ
MVLSILLLLAEVISGSDGVPIKYNVQGNGDTALVFIHCWSCDSSLWENQVTAFSKNHRVVTIDLPGHGESGKDRKEWSIRGYGGDVKTVVEKLGLKRVVLIGSSMGAMVALEAALQLPDRVVGVVFVDMLHQADQRPPADAVEATLKQMKSDYKGVTTNFMAQNLFTLNTPPAVKERLISQATSAQPEIAIPILGVTLKYDPIPAIQKIKAPIRAINSDLMPTNFEINRKYAPQFDAVIMKGVGHYPMLENPARFNELLAGILRDLGKQ